MLNPNQDTGVDAIFGQHAEATSLIDIPVTTIAEPSFFALTNRPPTPNPLFIRLQQPPILTPTTTSTLSSIPGIVDQYLANKMQEAVYVAVQLKYDRIREETHTENQQFLDSIDEGMKKVIKEQVKKEVSKITPKIEKLVNEQLESEVLVRSSKEAKTSHVVAANLSELELKKILIDKIEANNSINRSDIQRQLYKALVDAYEADKILLDTYGDTITIKRPRDGADDDQEPSAGTNRGSKRRRSGKEPESTSAPRETTTTTAGKTTTGSKTHKQSASQSPPVEETMQSTDVFEAPAHQEFETGVHDEQAEEEVHHLPDWFQQPKRLPSPNHAWNKSWWLSQAEKYSTSVTKKRQGAKDYGAIKWIEDLVPNSMWSQVIVNYDKFALWGISHWGKKRRQFYAFAITRESARDVYSKRRIIAVTKFIEGIFTDSYPRDIKDMAYFLVQGKLTNLNIEERIAFNVSLRMFTRSVVIQRRVEDLQLGVESYQKKLNLTKADT
ncbi:hypothetical protein Tco_0217847 [Tanacetum coccineum]